MAEAKKKRKRGRPSVARALKRFAAGAENAAEIMRIGRLGTPYAAAFDVVHEEPVFRLRHYRSASTDGSGARAHDPRLCPVLLVPPLMVTSEVYDIAPDLSAVGQLMRAGIDVWVTDFGAPEREEGGMARTLDDHVKAISTCIDRIREQTGKDVHVCGYSQGGMFAYQVAALRVAERGSSGMKTLVTFGSPVDIRRNLPVSSQLAGRVIAGARAALQMPLEAMEGLPGFLTSTGFKLLSVRKEVEQVADFVKKLHDREALEKRESRRRFLGGEGFVAWPGPAFRTFVDEFIVHNRMASGGFVIDGRSVTLADVTSPILYFVGTNDEIARAPSVRAIKHAAPQAEQHEIAVRAGHFGIVVGSKAVNVTWPSVIAWVRWKDGVGPKPAILEPTSAREPAEIDDEEFDEVQLDVDVFLDVASSAIDAVKQRAGDVAKEAGALFDNLRWQVPRLSRLRKIDADTRISMAKSLAEQAAAIPDHTFFLWKGRAFTYRDADRRVTAVVHGLVHAGVRPGAKVGVLMEARPSYLSMVCALNRMGAIAVLLSPDSTRVTLEQAIASAGIEVLVSDPDHAARARAAFAGPVLSLGGGPPSPDRAPLPDGVLDMETIDPDAVVLPRSLELDAGKASDQAMIIFTAGRREQPRPARITNRRWAFSALGAAAGCALTSDDTVYCCLPLTHAAGMLVAVGGALASGSRLALSKQFDADEFWPDVHRYGATVVFYAGEMLRPLVDAERTALDGSYPVRLFAGSGMRKNVWQRLRERFPRAHVLEFYASTEGNAVLANPAGKKIGSLGKALPGSADLALLAWSFEHEDFRRDEQGHIMVSGKGEPGVLVARVDPSQAMASFDGYENERETSSRLLRGVFDPGDAWFVTGDLMRRDEEGDYWFVDRLADVARTEHGPVPTVAVEDALEACRGVRMGVAYALDVGKSARGGDREREGTQSADGSGTRREPFDRTGGKQLLAASIVPRDGFDAAVFSADVATRLPAGKRPRLVRLVRAIPLTDGSRPRKTSLKDAVASVGPGESVLVYEEQRDRYVAATPDALLALGLAAPSRSREAHA